LCVVSEPPEAYTDGIQLDNNGAMMMGDKKVESHNQQGGITGFNVEVNSGGRESKRGVIRDLPLWLRWTVAASTVAGTIAFIILEIL